MADRILDDDVRRYEEGNFMLLPDKDPPRPLKQVVDRREFVHASVRSVAAFTAAESLLNKEAKVVAALSPTLPIIDSHMHVWADDSTQYPFPHPYIKDFKYEDVPHEATLEMLIDDMDQHGCSHAVLVQVIYHG